MVDYDHLRKGENRILHRDVVFIFKFSTARFVSRTIFTYTVDFTLTGRNAKPRVLARVRGSRKNVSSRSSLHGAVKERITPHHYYCHIVEEQIASETMSLSSGWIRTVRILKEIVIRLMAWHRGRRTIRRNE